MIPRPSIEDAKALQKYLRLLDRHIAWFDDEGFVMAHTDEERAHRDEGTGWKLSDCELHQSLVTADEMTVDTPGWYMWLSFFRKFVKLPVTPGQFGTPEGEA